MPRSRATFAGLLVLGVVVAGCSAPASEQGEAPARAEAPTGASGHVSAAGTSGTQGTNASAAPVRIQHELRGVITGPPYLGGIPRPGVPPQFPAELLTFDVPAAAESIAVTLSWTGTGDLDATLRAPGACPHVALLFPCDAAARRTSEDGWFHNGGGSILAPDSPSTITLGAADVRARNDCGDPTCAWSAWAYANGAIEVDFVLSVEIIVPAAAAP